MPKPGASDGPTEGQTSRPRREGPGGSAGRRHGGASLGYATPHFSLTQHYPSSKNRGHPNICFHRPNSRLEPPTLPQRHGRWHEEYPMLKGATTMNTHTRMSPLTALFLGIFGVGGVGIAAGAIVVLYSLRILDNKASALIGFAEHTVESLPELIDALPPAIGDVLNDRRAPDYAANLDVSVRFVANEQSEGVRPVVTVINKGKEVVSMLAVRVAALDARKVPVREWTEVVATPIAADDDWRGPLMPGATRHVVLSSWRSFPADKIEILSAAPEISELRVWEPKQSAGTPLNVTANSQQ